MKNRKYNKIMINDLEIEYYVTYSNVKYTRYKLDLGKLHLTISRRNRDSVEEIIHKKDKWIYNKIKEYNETTAKFEKLTKNKQIEQRSLSELKNLVNIYIEYYEKCLNVKVNRIQYRQMSRKWGSCSTLRNITLNKYLCFLPDNLVRYIVYHEMAHLIVMAHDDKFYDIIKKEFYDYKSYDDELDQYWYLIRKHFN